MKREQGQLSKDIEIDLTKNAEPLNRTLCECLIKYIDILGRKGCNRTALEYCKFLLAISPRYDPYGVLLRYDFYAIRAKEYNSYLDFSSEFCKQFHQSQDPLLLYPNFMLSSAICKHILAGERADCDTGLK